jgi:hypothetical protein
MASTFVVNTEAPAPAMATEHVVDTHLRCPQCGSDDTRKVSLVYGEGTSSISGSVRTYGRSSDGGTGYSFGNLSGSQQTELSRRLAPPAQKQHSPRAVAALFVTLMVVSFVVLTNGGTPVGVMAIGLPIAFLAFYAANGDTRAWNETELPKLRAEWERKFLCRRCGVVFEIY